MYCLIRWPSCKCKDNMTLWHNHLFESDRALHLHQSLILPAANHLEWEFCCLYNIWCMPLQQSGPEPCGDTAQLIILLCFSTQSLSTSTLLQKSQKSVILFDLQCVGVKPALSCQIKDPKWVTNPSLPLCCTRCLCPWKPIISPTLKLAKVSLFLKHQAMHSTIQSALLPKGLTSPTFPICC